MAAIPNYNNFLQMGNPTTNNFPTTGALTPEELWTVDTKTDDGLPGRGNTVVYPYNSSCTDASGITDLDSEYALQTKAQNCTILFVDIW